jgi:hypothetical protein
LNERDDSEIINKKDSNMAGFQASAKLFARKNYW